MKTKRVKIDDVNLDGKNANLGTKRGRDQSTVWNIDNPRAHQNHPTEKPPEIFSRSMGLNTENGALCYEPFSGSGSQLCAAQATGRICFAMEIEPKYVAVALERMAEMGLKPELANNR